jgi:hypothetical protein
LNLKREADSGQLSAALDIDIPIQDPAARRGRGAMRIRDATLYDQPVATALLRAGNFMLPDGSPLTAASARYLIRGSDVLFDSVRFTGPGLAITGGGSMTLPDRSLQLTLVNRDTRNIQLGFITDLLDLFKDELLTIEVAGTLDQPEARLVTFSGLRASWDALFNRSAAEAIPEIDPLGRTPTSR